MKAQSYGFVPDVCSGMGWAEGALRMVLDASGPGTGKGYRCTRGTGFGFGRESGTAVAGRVDARFATGEAVGATLAAAGVGVERGVKEVGFRVATAAAVGCSKATPGLGSCDGPPRTSECIKNNAPAPTELMNNSDASIAFVDRASGRVAKRASLGLEGSSGPSGGRERRGTAGLAPSFAIVLLFSTGRFTIS